MQVGLEDDEVFFLSKSKAAAEASSLRQGVAVPLAFLFFACERSKQEAKRRRFEAGTQLHGVVPELFVWLPATFC